MMPVISNTTVISNFAAVERLGLLKRRFARLHISDQVFEEIKAGLLQGYAFYANLDRQMFPFSETGWLHLTALNTIDEFQTFGRLTTTLNSGESSCLSIAHHRKWAFLSDDKAARRAGSGLKVPISGTVGVLLSLVRANMIPLTEADMALEEMIQTGYYSPVASLREILSSSKRPRPSEMDEG